MLPAECLALVWGEVMIWVNSNAEVSGTGPFSADIPSIEVKVFARVAILLARAGLKVEGAGSLAIGLSEEGGIEIGGDVVNRAALIAALDGDPELIALLIAATGSDRASDG